MRPEYEALLARAGRVAPYHGNARLVEALAAAVRDLDARAEAAEAERDRLTSAFVTLTGSFFADDVRVYAQSVLSERPS